MGLLVAFFHPVHQRIRFNFDCLRLRFSTSSQVSAVDLPRPKTRAVLTSSDAAPSGADTLLFSTNTTL